MRWRHLSLLVAIVSLPTVATATIILDLKVEKMAEVAPLILIGEVTNSHSGYNFERTKIYTWIDINPSEVLKGDAPQGKVTVKVIGGQVGDIFADMRGAPRFESGEQVLVFLEPREDGDGYLTIGMFMGKFELRRDQATGKQILFRPKPERGVQLAGPRNHGYHDTVLELTTVRDIIARAGGTR